MDNQSFSCFDFIVANTFDCEDNESYGTNDTCFCPNGLIKSSCKTRTFEYLFYLQLLIKIACYFFIFIFIECADLCSNDNTTNGAPLVLINFGNVSDKFPNRTLNGFNFSTSYRPASNITTEPGTYEFVNKIPQTSTEWQNDTLDHTRDNIDGYMFLVHVTNQIDQAFNYKMNNLCIGICYKFSVNLNHAVQSEDNVTRLNISLEIRSPIEGGDIIASTSINDTWNFSMAWSKYTLPFVATTSSIVLLIISNVDEGNSTLLAIDDVELHVCSNHSGLCSPGLYISFLS